jgi:lysylphosphatidylglycerol synthetase-like protein (DUF2156 family)
MAGLATSATSADRETQKRKAPQGIWSAMALNVRNTVTIVGAAILIGAEVFGIAFAAGWAIAGLFELGDTIQYLLKAIFSLIGIYAMWKFVQAANKVEPMTK